MNKIICKALLLLMLVAAAFSAGAQSRQSLQLVEAFDAGQPQAVILKLYDQQADVICYVLTPERASRQQSGGVWLYEGNNVGSISCLKQRQHIIDVTPTSKVTPNEASESATTATTSVRVK